MSAAYALALADVFFLLATATCAIVLEKRDYADANFELRLLLVLFAFAEICLALTRLSLMTHGQPSSYPLRVLADFILTAVFAARLREGSARHRFFG